MEAIQSFWNLINEDKNRLCYTCLIFFNHFSIGITMNILSACLVDLSYIYHVDLDKITYLSTSLGIGYILGSLAGFTYSYVNRQLLLSVMLSILAITTLFIPRYYNFISILIGMFFSGMGFGAWNGSQTCWIVELWPEYPTFGLQSTELLYGLGSIFGPLLASSYVFGENQTVSIEQRIKSLIFPFSITAILQLIVPILLFWLNFSFPYRKPMKKDKDLENEHDNDIKTIDEIPHRTIKLVFGALLLGTYVAAESNYTGFSPTMFQHIGIKLSANEAAIVASLLQTTFTLGRLITTFIGNYITPDNILKTHFVIIFSSLACLYFGQNSRSSIYIFSLTLGYGFSAMTAAIMSFSERHLKLTDKVCSFYAFTAGIFVVFVPLILSQTFQKYPHVLFIIQASFLSTCLLNFILIKLMIYKDRKS